MATVPAYASDETSGVDNLSVVIEFEGLGSYFKSLRFTELVIMFFLIPVLSLVCVYLLRY